MEELEPLIVGKYTIVPLTKENKAFIIDEAGRPPFVISKVDFEKAIDQLYKDNF